MFRRRKSADSNGVDEVDLDATEAAADEVGESGEAEPTPVAPVRPTGPWDVEDAPTDGLTRLDLGGLQVPGLEGMEIQVNLDESSGNVIAVTAVIGDSALQLQPFAAPRGEGIWAEVRREIAAEITRDGGLADVVTDEGLDGYLMAQLPFPQPDGSSALRPVRFIGVDGPRWFLRGVLTGAAAVDPAAAAPLMAVFRGSVVVRGGDPLAPRDPIALRLPQDANPVGAEPAARTLEDLDPGPTIAEIR